MYYIYIYMFKANFTTQRNLGKRWRTIQLLSNDRDLAQTEIMTKVRDRLIYNKKMYTQVKLYLCYCALKRDDKIILCSAIES